MLSLKKNAVLLLQQLAPTFKKIAKSIAFRVSKTAQRTDSAVLFVFAGGASWLGGQKDKVTYNLCHAAQQAPNSVWILLLYAHTQRWQGQPWQQLEILERQKSRFHNNFRYWMSLGQLQLTMYRLTEARSSLEHALTLQKGSAKVWWLLGWALEELGEPDASNHAYAQAVAHSWHPKVRRYGVGEWFARIDRWGQAVRAYSSRLHAQQDNPRKHAQLLIRRALGHEHLLNWEQAASDYQYALQLTPRCDVGKRLAWAYARAGMWPQAQAECQRLLSKPRWAIWSVIQRVRIRKLLAVCLCQQKQPRQAAEQFMLAFATDSWIQRYLLQPAFLPSPKPRQQAHARLSYPHIEQARQAWTRRDWVQAAASLEMSVQRWPVHAPSLFAAWGHALANAGEWDAACKAFRQASLYRWPVNVVQRKLERKQAQRLVMEYTEYLETLPVQPQAVMYESYAGISISCNPYAIYRTIVDEPEFAGWTHIWVLNDLNRIPADCVGRSNVIFVSRNSQLYQRYLATAGWLINNSTFPSYFIRRDGQKYLNTWHGTPLKTLGKDIRGNFMEHKNTARNLLHATHIISPNEHTSHVLLERNDIDGLYQGQLAQTGCPRNDIVLNATTEQKNRFRQQLGLPATDKPLVLYAPTWRGIFGHPEINAERLITDLQFLQQKNCQIVFRGHYFVEQALTNAGLKNICIAPQTIDTSELLAVTDVLITDYSSIFFDYLPTGRPILFYTYDLEQYSQERGLYFDMEEMPGPNCFTVQQLSEELTSTLEQITQASWQPDTRYRAAQQKFCPNEDGQAAVRAIEFFFKSKHEIALEPKQDGRKTLLFFAGPFAPMGITTAAINLISALDAKQYRIVVAIDPDTVGSQPQRVERLNRLPAHVQIIGRVGRQVCSPQERSVIDTFMRRDDLSAAQWAVYATAFQREFLRMFGTVQPHCVINYDGYARFWGGLLAYGPAVNVRRLMYLHNDMYGEWQMKYPHFAGMFALYPRYHFLVSVSEGTREINQRRLAQRLGIQPQRFVYADNIPDFDVVRKKAQEPLDADLAAWLGSTPPGHTFVTIGRLSPEKNHVLLLQAFAILLQSHPLARLVILGEGSLRAELKMQIEQLNLTQAVILPGVCANPFPLLQRSDCFVLSSKHEGQPMVLLEAMVLNKPIIATNIPGVRELLASGYGQLVALDPAELAEAFVNQIKKINEDNINAIEFSAYTVKALRKFENLLCKPLH